MNAFVVAAFVCAVAHLTQGGVLPQKNTQKRGISAALLGGGADIHGNGLALGGGDYYGGNGVGLGGKLNIGLIGGGISGLGSGLGGKYTNVNYNSGPWENNYGGNSYGSNGYGGSGYGSIGYGGAATSYSSGIIRGSGGVWANKYGGSVGNVGYGGNLGYGGNVAYGSTGGLGGYGGGHSGPWANNYGSGGVSNTQRYDGHGAGYSASSLKLNSGASTYSTLSYGGSKY